DGFYFLVLKDSVCLGARTVCGSWASIVFVSRECTMRSHVVGSLLLVAILAGCSAGESSNPSALPELVEVAGPAREVMQAGEYLLDGRLIASDTVMYVPVPTLKAMKYQVSQFEYDQCVRAERCKAADAVGQGQAKNLPVVGVSWQD